MASTPRSGQVIWHTTMSLDGFIADPGERMDWVFDVDAGRGLTQQATAERLGALLAGRRTMRVQDETRRGFYGGAFRGPFFVLTHEPQSEPPVVEGVPGTYLSGPIEDAVATALAAAQGRDVAVLGATTATQALGAGLVDEVIVQVVPVLLGAGTPLHRGDLHRLWLLETSRDGEVTTLRFSTRAPAAG